MGVRDSRVWRGGAEVRHGVAVAELGELLNDEQALIWVDLVNPTPEELTSLEEQLALDANAVSDALEPRERPKATVHRNHLFLNCYATEIQGNNPEGVQLRTGRVSAFVLPNALITVRPDGQVNMDAVVEDWVGTGMIGQGVAGLVHGLLDHLIDGHFDTIEDMDDVLERLEDLLFDPALNPRQIQQQVFRLRKSLVQLRRVVLPMREVVTTLMRYRAETDRPVNHALDTHFNELYDHAIRASEWTESLRDMLSSVFETNLSLQDARLNEVMKKLAAWAAIIAVPTAVTGWFGQNVPYPGYGDWTGLAWSAALIVGGAIGLYLVFRKVDWI